MLEEDLDKERFFAFARRTYWESPNGSPTPRADADAHRQAGFLIADCHRRQSGLQAAGVDIDAGNETVRRIKSLARGTFTPGVLSDIGSFGGLFRLDRERYRSRCWCRAPTASAPSSRSRS